MNYIVTPQDFQQLNQLSNVIDLQELSQNYIILDDDQTLQLQNLQKEIGDNIKPRSSSASSAASSSARSKSASSAASSSKKSVESDDQKRTRIGASLKKNKDKMTKDQISLEKQRGVTHVKREAYEKARRETDRDLKKLNDDQKITRKHKADAKKALQNAKTPAEIAAAQKKMDAIKADLAREKADQTKLNKDRAMEDKKYDEFDKARTERTKTRKAWDADKRRVSRDQKQLKAIPAPINLI